METVNRREFTRVAVELEVAVSAGGRRLVVEKTRDLSLNGLFVPAESPLPEGAECRVTIHLGEHRQAPRIEAGGRVARVSERGFAIAFTDIELESVEHLRKVILYGSEDLSRVEEEFDRHVGLRTPRRD